MELEKTMESFKRYINSQEQKLDDYYRMDEEFYKDEIEQLELSLKLLRAALTHITQQEKMIDKMADEILDLNSMIAEKSEFFSVVPIWLGKEHIKEYFKGITNKKAEEVQNK